MTGNDGRTGPDRPTPTAVPAEAVPAEVVPAEVVPAEVADRAYAAAVEAHGDQTWGVHPYRVHLDAVAAHAERLRRDLVPGLDPGLVRLVAVLHDTVEDTRLGPDDLRRLGAPQAALVALRLLTHEPGQAREPYLEAICTDLTATLVKLADTLHNAAPQSLAELAARDPDRAARLRDKYAGQQERLRTALRAFGLPA